MQSYIDETHEYYEEVDTQYERALSWSIEAVVGKLQKSRGTKLEQIELKDIDKLKKTGHCFVSSKVKNQIGKEWEFNSLPMLYYFNIPYGIKLLFKLLHL